MVSAKECKCGIYSIGSGHIHARNLQKAYRVAAAAGGEEFLVIRNGRDIVTHVPPGLLWFRHVGTLLEIGRGKGYNAVESHYPENYQAELRDLYEQ